MEVMKSDCARALVAALYTMLASWHCDDATLTLEISHNQDRVSWTSKLWFVPRQFIPKVQYAKPFNYLYTMRELGPRPTVADRALYAISEGLFAGGLLGTASEPETIRVKADLEQLTGHEIAAAIALTAKWAEKAPSTAHLPILMDRLANALTSREVTELYPVAQGSTFIVEPYRVDHPINGLKYRPNYFSVQQIFGVMVTSSNRLNTNFIRYAAGERRVQELINEAWRDGLRYCEFAWPDMGIAYDRPEPINFDEVG